MPAPIPFAVAAAPRQGTFQTAPMAYPGGYSRIYWEMDIPIKSEYEDPGRSFMAQLLIDGDPSAVTWTGGRSVNKQGTVDAPPAIKYDIRQVPAGATLQVRISVPVAMTIGIKNGVID